MYSVEMHSIKVCRTAHTASPVTVALMRIIWCAPFVLPCKQGSALCKRHCRIASEGHHWRCRRTSAASMLPSLCVP